MRGLLIESNKAVWDFLDSLLQELEHSRNGIDEKMCLARNMRVSANEGQNGAVTK